MLQSQIIERRQLNAPEWDAFIFKSPQGAPYFLSWYLDAVWPEWQAIVVSQNNEKKAVMPIKISRKFGISYAFTPPFCQYGGVCFAPFEGTRNNIQLTLKKKLVREIIRYLNDVKVFSINFAPEFDYPLPFFWSGFRLQTRYSYWLQNTDHKQNLFKGLAMSIRTYIRAARKDGLTVHTSQDIQPLLNLALQKNKFSMDIDALRRLWVASSSRQAANCLTVFDENGFLHAGLVYLKFNQKIINIFSAMDTRKGHKGSMSLCMWHLIEQAEKDTQIIDFEGSMIESVEHFFRQFGGVPVPYLQISRIDFPRPFQWIFDR